jgi:hypothetical protein
MEDLFAKFSEDTGPHTEVLLERESLLCKERSSL